MADNTDPTKPTANEEKFKPQNVSDTLAGGGPPSRAANRPADTKGIDVQKGSHGDNGRRSRGPR